MGSLAVGYVIAGVTVVLYVSWLGCQNRHLAQQVRELEAGRNANEQDRLKSRAA